MTISLAKNEDLVNIIEIFKQRVDWFEENGIQQWGSCYYIKKYNENYFKEAMVQHKLYVAKSGEETIGVFLLKEHDEPFWKDNVKAYYIHHFATKLGYSGIGNKILHFIVQKAKADSKTAIRLDCIRNNAKLNCYYEQKGFQFAGSGEQPYSYNLWEKRVAD